MRGLLSAERLHELTDSEGKSLYDVLKARGLDPDNVPNQKFTTPLKAFLELHIEQGAVLENAECPLSIVTGISAPSRCPAIHGTADLVVLRLWPTVTMVAVPLLKYVLLT